MAEPDYARIKRNISKMISQGAPETDIDAYVSSESVTPEMLRGATQAAPAPAAAPATTGWETPLQATSGVNEGLANALGGPVDLVNTGIRGLMGGANMLLGTNMAPSESPVGGSDFFKGLLTSAGTIQPPTDDTTGQVVRRIGQSVGAAAVPGAGVVASSARPAAAIAGLLAPAVAGGAAAAGANQLFPGNPYADAAAEIAGSLAVGGPMAIAANRAGRRAAEGSVPTVEALRTQAGDLYEAARRNGVTAPQQEVQGLANNLRTIAQDEGLISPTGRISEAYPKAREAIRLADDYATGTMTVPQMQTVRKVLSDAAGSADAAERRMAVLMLRQFDDFTAPLAPELENARALYTRAMKGDTLETARELAGARAGNFTDSGFENALRTEYRSLDRKIIKGQERGFSPAEEAAIQQTSRGTPVQNMARGAGRFAPKGAVSFMGGVGVPFMIGNAIGGPTVGAALAGATAGAGYGARGIATNMGVRNAEIAELLARSGGAIPANQVTPEMLRIAAALLASQNTTRPEQP